MINALLQLKKQMDKHKDNPAALIAEIIRKAKYTMLYQGDIYTYESNVYIKQSKKTMLAIIQNIIPRDILSKCSLKAQKDAIELIYATSEVVDSIPKYEDKINLQNGVYCISNNCLEPAKPEYKFTYILNVSYNENAVAPQFMDFIKQTFKKESMILHIQEVFGYLISDCPPLKEFLLFYGPSNTSKSVLAAIIRGIIGNEYVSSVNIRDLNNEYYLASLCDKRLNICSDIGSTAISDLSVIKQLTSPDDTLQIRHIRQDTQLITEKPKLLFASNHYPNLVSNTEDLDAFFNRVHIIPFKNIIPKNEQIDGYAQMLLDKEKEGIFRWAMEGYRRFLSNGKQFTPAKRVLKAQMKYRSQYMLPRDFVSNCVEFSPDKKESTKEVEKALKWYCEYYEVTYSSDMLQNVRKILVSKGAINKTIRNKKKTLRGFCGIKLIDPPEANWSEDFFEE